VGPTGPTGPTGPAGGGADYTNTEPDNARAYTVNQCTGAIDIWNGATGKSLGSIPLASSPLEITINQTTKLAYVTESDGSLQVIDLRTNQIVATLPNNYGTRPAVNENTNTVYVADAGSPVLNVINGADNSVVTQIPLSDIPAAIAVDPTLNRIFVAEPGANAIQVIDGNTNQVIQTIPVPNAPLRIAVNPNTHMVYVVSENPNGASSSNEELLTTINGSTGFILNRQPFPGDNQGGDIAVDTVNNQVMIATDLGSGSTYLFDGDGNLIRQITTTNNDGYDTGAAVNPETGNTYQVDPQSGLSIYNKNGDKVQTIPSPCADGVDVTNL
jgi:YVTN family beta-propeller protein